MTRTASHLLLPLLLVVLLAPVALAKGGDMEFGPPPKPGVPTADQGTTKTEPPPKPEDPILEEIADLDRWPDRIGERAADSLLLRGPVVVPYLVKVLEGDDSPRQPGAAWVLGQMGEPAHIQILLRAAARRHTGSRAEVFFDAAYGLDPEKTKHWLFSFLTLNRPVFRARATDFLMDHVDEADQRRVLNLLEADKGSVRVSGLRLLDPAKVPDAVERLLQALSDLDPDVCRQASVLLALRADDALVARLNRIAVEGLPRERAYATLALVEVARTRNTNPFTPETLGELAGRRGILHPEKLPRGAAAVGLAYGALDSSDPSLQALLDGTVVNVLIDTVGGAHFRDFSSLVDPVFGALRRLSGLDLPSTAVSWAQWWEQERDSFHARRPLEGFDRADLSKAYVAVELIDAEGGRRRAVFRSEDAAIQAGDFILESDVMLALVRALDAAGIFEADAVTPPSAEEQVLVTLGVLNQTRRMAVPAGDPRYPLLRMRFDSLLGANRWQRYRDADRWPDAKEWWVANADTVRQADPETRRQLLDAAIVASFDDLGDDTERAEALDELEDMERESGTSGGLTATQVRALVEAATSSIGFGAVEQRAVRFAIAQEAAGQVQRSIVDALAGRSEPAAAEMLSGLLASGGPNAVRDAFADPRAVMRGAAARAAETLVRATKQDEPKALPTLKEALQPGLEVLTHDDAQDVAIRADVALHHLGDPNAVSRLEDLYKQGDMAVKIAVADGLAGVEPEDAYPLLNLMLATERDPRSAPLRAAALRSLGRTKHPNAVGLLVFYLLNDADAAVQIASANALVDLQSEEARLQLVRHLTEGRLEAPKRARLLSVLGHFRGRVVREVLSSYVEDKDPAVSRAAALGLAAQNDGSAVPYLIDILRGGDPDQASKALRALEDLSLQRFDPAGYAVLAEQYERWYKTARITPAREPDRAWLRERMRTEGYDVGPLGPYVDGGTDPVAVPVLIRALRDDDPLIRRGAAIALERITGMSLGTVERGTSRADAAEVAAAWNRWWDRVSAPSDGR